MSTSEISAVLADLRRLSDRDPDAEVRAAEILATKHALVARLEADQPLPTTPPAPVVTCAAPGCANPVHRPRRRGRPPIYCSPACRSRSRRRPTPGPLLVEVDHEPDHPGPRPAGPIWLVRLRRDTRTVTLATGLGRPSAEHLAHQITDLLTTPGGAID
jgi:hypothetical protein